MKSLLNTILVIGTFVFCESSSSHISTLTTAREWYSGSPKPRSFRKRLNIESINEELSSTPLDLFRIRDPERRNHIDSVWKWDFWCQLQPKTGNCSVTRREQMQEVPTIAYYYDAQLDTCLTFLFSGCNGNENRFENMVECERRCKGATYMMLKDSTRSTYCSLQPDVGLCMTLIQRFYFDVNRNECKSFMYGGCGGNQNRFRTKALCNQRCNAID